MRLERLRRRAAGNRLHHRRLDLDEAARVQKIPDFADDFAALEENVLHLRVRHQIEVTLAVADFRVGEAVPFFRRRPQRLGENDEAIASLMEISPVLVVNNCSAHADEIAEVEVRENAPLLVAEDIFLRINLDAPALVAHVNEHGFAHVAVRGDASGDGDFAAFGVILPRVAAHDSRRRELVFERVNALGAQRGELGLALFNQ